MRSGVLVIGAILLIFGFMIFWSGYSVMQQYNTSVGQLALGFSSYAQQQYAQAKNTVILGGILGLVGFILCIYGAATKPLAPTKTVAIEEKYEAPHEPLPDRMFCRFCGTQIPADSEYCPKCGRNQK